MSNLVIGLCTINRALSSYLADSTSNYGLTFGVFQTYSELTCNDIPTC